MFPLPAHCVWLCPSILCKYHFIHPSWPLRSLQLTLFPHPFLLSVQMGDLKRKRYTHGLLPSPSWYSTSCSLTSLLLQYWQRSRLIWCWFMVILERWWQGYWHGLPTLHKKDHICVVSQPEGVIHMLWALLFIPHRGDTSDTDTSQCHVSLFCASDKTHLCRVYVSTAVLYWKEVGVALLMWEVLQTAL